MATKETSREKRSASFNVYVNGEHLSTIEMAKPMTAKQAVREAERTAKQQALMSHCHTLLLVSLGCSVAATVKAIPEPEGRGKRWKVMMYTEMFDF